MNYFFVALISLFTTVILCRDPFAFEERTTLSEEKTTTEMPEAVKKWRIQEMNQTTFSVTSTLDGTQRTICLPRK